MNCDCEIAIVGGGAAGLAAAIFAGEAAGALPQSGRRRPRIVILDGARTSGAKILVSGGGRCNVTHERIQATDFNGSPNIVRNILAAFDVWAAVRWFESLGVELKREETGKLFPVTNSARTILSALLDRCRELDVEIRTQHRVQTVQAAGTDPAKTIGPFAIRHEQGQLVAQRIIMATGGRSLPKTGSDGMGWEILRRLGHSVNPTYPALVPLVLADSFFHAELSGLSHPVELSTVADNKPIDRRTGSLLWTHFGISGPVVMDASRHWIMANSATETAELRCSLLPGEDFEAVERSLIDLTAAKPQQALDRALSRRLPERLATAILRWTGIEPNLPAGRLPREQRRALVHHLIALPLPVIDHRGWNYAEVTAGGIPLSEINYRNMASRKVPELYLAGEVLDCDGRIGGFNFQWAWATGYLAGRAAASGLP